MGETSHHPCTDSLVRLAAGWVGAAEAVLLNTHLTLCAGCRAHVEQLEEIGGAVLAEKLEPNHEVASLIDHFLSNLKDEPLVERAPVPENSGLLPRVLLRYTGPAEKLPWRTQLPNISVVNVMESEGSQPLRLFRFAGGSRVPLHDHTGDERLVVLQGGYQDSLGHFVRGDFSFVPRSLTDHDQRIDEGEDCIALVLNDEPAVPKNLALRLLGKLVSL